MSRSQRSARKSNRPRRPGQARSIRSQRLAIAAAALALAAAAAAPSGAEVPIPSFPPIPPIHIHLPKPNQTAVFDVIVEGKATSEVISRLELKDSTCLYKEEGTVKDKTTYLRGRGVRIEFDRYGKELLVHRTGRETDSTLAATITTIREASGESHASPYTTAPCSIPTEDLSKTPDCKVPVHPSGALALAYEHESLHLTPTNSTQLGGNFVTDECGQDKQTGRANEFNLAWPNQPKLEPARLTSRQIFGRGKTIILKLLSSDRHIPVEEVRNITSPPPGGTNTERAFNEATVRLIRVKHG